MQVSFDPTNPDEREAVACMLGALEGGEAGEAKPAKRSKKAAVEVPVAASALPTPALVAPVAASGMPPMPDFLNRASPAVPVAPFPAPVAQAHVPAPSSGVTKIQMTQAIQSYTAQHKVAKAKERLSEFAKTFGLAEPLALDAIPEGLYPQVVETFKVG